MPKMSTCLWFNGDAADAVDFYLEVFKNGKVLKTVHYPPEAAKQHEQPEGSVLTVEFEMNGQTFIALNAENLFKFNESISFVIDCETQKDIDYYWEKLTAGGEESQCGWLKDKFGLSWQIVPTVLKEMLNNADSEKSRRVINAFMQMKKFNLEKLKMAYEGRS